MEACHGTAKARCRSREAAVIVWVWDAHGPDRSAGGVSDDEKRARKLARESLLSTGASDVLVEAAFTELGIKTLSYGYVRTGQGWLGHRTAGGVLPGAFTASGTVRERTAARA
jgi:hypothetical protein